MEGDKLRAEKKAALQTYFGTAWRAEDGAAGSFRTVDNRLGFYPAHVFWVYTREEYEQGHAVMLDDGHVLGNIFRDPLATITRGGIDYLIVAEHSIQDLERQREANRQAEPLTK